MKFEALLRLVGGEPLFESGLLMAGETSPALARLQLSRWVRAGKLVQLRRGLYALAESYARVVPHPFLTANRLRGPSYVSLQSALAWHGMIPEAVPVVTSVTSGRPGEHRTALGDFLFRHLKQSAFRGYRRVEVQQGQWAFVATPEKCLLDLAHLTPGGETEPYLRELRLQHLDCVSVVALRRMAREWGSPKLTRAAERIAALKGENA